MADIEFLDGPDEPPPPSADPVRSPWRRWTQPVLVAVVGVAGAVAVISSTAGSDDPAPSVHEKKQPATPSVHIYRYAPWHERAIPYGGGGYIY